MGTAADNANSVLMSETNDYLFNIFEPKITAQASAKVEYRY